VSIFFRSDMYHQPAPSCTRIPEWAKVASLSAALFAISFYVTEGLQHTALRVQAKPLRALGATAPSSVHLGTLPVPTVPLDQLTSQTYQDPRGSRLPVPLRALSAASFGIGAVLALAGYLVPRRRDVIAMAAAAGAPAAGAPRPTLADTKAKFLALSDACIANMYNIPIQELLAQHHLIRYSSKYQYDELFALGIVTVINQLMEGSPDAENERIQNAYFGALGEDIAKFKQDALELEEWARSRGKDLTLDGTDAVTEKLKVIAARAGSSEFQYSKFFSIGLFQMLQQSGQTDPETFTALVKALSLDKEKVTKDLKVYKDLLKRLEMAKDMKEKFLERERRKQAERAAAKAQPVV